jgi:hypothetical protein
MTLVTSFSEQKKAITIVKRSRKRFINFKLNEKEIKIHIINYRANNL